MIQQIRVFLEGSKQFLVPLFQREYVWEKKHTERLWDDIKETETELLQNGTSFFWFFCNNARIWWGFWVYLNLL